MTLYMIIVNPVPQPAKVRVKTDRRGYTACCRPMMVAIILLVISSLLIGKHGPDIERSSLAVSRTVDCAVFVITIIGLLTSRLFTVFDGQKGVCLFA